MSRSVLGRLVQGTGSERTLGAFFEPTLPLGACPPSSLTVDARTRLVFPVAAACWLSAALALVLLAPTFAAAQSDAETSTDDDPAIITAVASDDQPIERLLLLAPGQPLRIDLVLAVEGQGVRPFWKARIDELFADADVSRTGRLSLDEALRLVEGAAGEFGLKPSRDKTRSALQSLGKAAGGSTTGDGRIDREAIYGYLRRVAAPFVVDAAIAPGSAAAPALFGLIDADHDAQLSRDELASAAARLIVRDFDDDGLISERELVVDPTQHAERTTEEETVSRRSAPKAASLLWIAPDAKPARLAAAVLRRYDRDGNGKLLAVVPEGAPASAIEIRLTPAAIREFDTNADGSLDAGELPALVLQPAEIVLPLGFGNPGSGGQPAATLPGKSSELRVRKKIDGGYKIYVEDAQIDVNRNNRNPQQNSELEFRFSRFDADKSGYLEMKEVGGDPLISAAFAGMDADGDGHVVQSEFQSYIDRQNTSASARVRLEVIDRGQDLFAVIDGNGDGLLTPRELAEAVSLIDTEDRNGDGLLSGMEIPARWSLDLARGSSRRDIRPVRLRVRSKQLAAGEAGPLWFRKMDRNHDGDVSPAEFLGNAADFTAADTSSDGLIDAAEATALGGGK